MTYNEEIEIKAAQNPGRDRYMKERYNNNLWFKHEIEKPQKNII